MKLIQHDFLDNPWKMMAACCLVNQTRGKTARPYMDELFSSWPTCVDLAAASPDLVSNIVSPLGFGQRRANTLIKMAGDAASGKLIGLWYGVGKYAMDSWLIFGCGAMLWPNDKELRVYMEWCTEVGEFPPAYTNQEGEILRPEPTRIMRLDAATMESLQREETQLEHQKPQPR